MNDFENEFTKSIVAIDNWIDKLEDRQIEGLSNREEELLWELQDIQNNLNNINDQFEIKIY